MPVSRFCLFEQHHIKARWLKNQKKVFKLKIFNCFPGSLLNVMKVDRDFPLQSRSSWQRRQWKRDWKHELTPPRSKTRLFWVHLTSVSGTEPSTSHDKVIWLSVTNCFGLWTILVDIGFTVESHSGEKSKNS